MIKFLELQAGTIIPTEHCYTIKWLKDILDKYPDNHLKVYAYIYYMTCNHDELNPYFNVPLTDKEEIILKDIEADFSVEDPEIIIAIENAHKLFETSMSRAYKGISAMLDRLAIYMEITPISHGRDGNINSLLAAGAKYDSIRNSFKGAYRDLKEEQETRTRGGGSLAYDQKH
jgi:hypothetical protein